MRYDKEKLELSDWGQLDATSNDGCSSRFVKKGIMASPPLAAWGLKLHRRGAKYTRKWLQLNLDPACPSLTYYNDQTMRRGTALDLKRVRSLSLRLDHVDALEMLIATTKGSTELYTFVLPVDYADEWRELLISAVPAAAVSAQLHRLSKQRPPVDESNQEPSGTTSIKKRILSFAPTSWTSPPAQSTTKTKLTHAVSADSIGLALRELDLPPQEDMPRHSFRENDTESIGVAPLPLIKRHCFASGTQSVHALISGAGFPLSFLGDFGFSVQPRLVTGKPLTGITQETGSFSQPRCPGTSRHSDSLLFVVNLSSRILCRCRRIHCGPSFIALVV